MGIELSNDQIYCVYDLENWWNKQDKQVFEISGKAGTGKAQPIDTIIPTPEGDKRLGDLKVGDYVFNRYGKPVKVLAIFDKGELDTYKVTFEDGRYTLCNKDHLWSYYDAREATQTLKTGPLSDIMNQQMMRKHIGYVFSVPASHAVEYPEKEFVFDPYVVGAFVAKDYWKEITHQKTERIVELYPELGNSSSEKRIPKDYLYGSIDQRWSLIQGLFDSNGTVTTEGSVSYATTNFALANDIKNILASLGCVSVIHIRNRIKNDVVLTRYVVNVHSDNPIKPNFFRLPRKKIKANKIKDNYRHHDYTKLKIHNIEDLGYKTEMRCIYVDDEEHLYLTNDYIVTHNTTVIRYFIERLGLSYDNVLFLAYMGKAASVLSRNGLPGKTIHSTIYDFAEKVARDEEGKIIINSNGKPKLIPYFKLKDHISKKIKLIVVDEASMVSKDIAEDLLSFNIPVIALGDLNQLPPVFGNPYFLNNPDVILNQIMRQAEGNPIIWLANQILEGHELKYGVYGNSAVIPKKDITEFQFRKADIILTGTNRLRYNINNYCRTEIKGIKNLEYPHVGEKVICRKNNWNQSIGNNIYLTNGTAGFVDYIYRDSFNKKTMKMDFRPDFTKKVFHNIEFDYQHMYAVPGQEETTENPFGFYYDKMEFAYAITTHASQGSAWGNVLYMHENFMRNPVDAKKLKYTAVTRASDSITIVI